MRPRQFWSAAAACVGLLALAGSFALAELAVLLPRAGGNYVYLRDGFGRWAGFLYGWVEFWIIRGASAANETSLLGDGLHMLPVANATRSRHHQHAFIDNSGSSFPASFR